jgi:hypothetical protein
LLKEVRDSFEENVAFELRVRIWKLSREERQIAKSWVSHSKKWWQVEECKFRSPVLEGEKWVTRMKRQIGANSLGHGMLD